MKLFFLLLFSISMTTISAQIVNEKKIGELIKNKEFDQAKLLLDSLTETKMLSDVDWYNIRRFKIKVSIWEGERNAAEKLMHEYVFSSRLDSVLLKDRKRLLNDTLMVFIKKSQYSNNLMNAYFSQGKYKKALLLLNLSEQQYNYTSRPYNHAGEFHQKTIRGEIYHHLNKHDQVIETLLPLTFDYPHIGFTEQQLEEYHNTIDSFLLISLLKKHTKDEIKSAFEKCMKSIPIESTKEEWAYAYPIEMLNANFTIPTISMYEYKKIRKSDTSHVITKEDEERFFRAIFIASYTDAFKSNRIYKKLISKD